jgi:acetaldehyde dehydrogenase
MRNTIYTKVNKPDLKLITEAIHKMVEKIKEYVPGYRVRMEPIMQDDVVTCIIEVEGLGDYLPVYSGNLDIITSAAVKVAEIYAKKVLGGDFNV